MKNTTQKEIIMKRIVLTALMLAIAPVWATYDDVRDADYGSFRCVEVYESEEVHDLRTDVGEHSNGYVDYPYVVPYYGQLSGMGAYITFIFEPENTDDTYDDHTCAFYSPWSAHAASVRIVYTGNIEVTVIADGQSVTIYESPAYTSTEREVLLPIPPSCLNTEEVEIEENVIKPTHRCDFQIKVENNYTSIPPGGPDSSELYALDLSWETHGWNISIQPNHFIDGSYVSGYENYERFIADNCPGAINQHVSWEWVQPTGWPWHWQYDESEADDTFNYYDINSEETDPDLLEIGARYDIARALRFYSGTDDWNFRDRDTEGDLLFEAGLAKYNEIWIQPNIQIPGRWATYGNDEIDALNDTTLPYDDSGTGDEWAADQLLWHPGLTWYVKPTGMPPGYSEEGTDRYFGFDLNNRFYDPMFRWTDNYWGEHNEGTGDCPGGYDKCLRRMLYEDSSVGLYFRDADEYYIAREKLKKLWLTGNYPGSGFVIADEDILDESTYDLGGGKVPPVNPATGPEYVGWSDTTTAIPREPLTQSPSDQGVTPTIRHFLQYTVEEIEELTGTEDDNFGDDEHPYFRVGLNRSADECNIAGYLMTNEGGFHGGVSKHDIADSTIGDDGDEYFVRMNAYSESLEDYFDDWLRSIGDFETYDEEGDEIWADSGYDSVDDIEEAWDIDLSIEDYHLPTRIVVLDDELNEPTCGSHSIYTADVEFNSWEYRLFDELNNTALPSYGTEYYELGNNLTGGQIRLWYDYIRYIHHIWERYYSWAPGVINGTLDDTGLGLEVESGERPLLGNEQGFNGAWNAKLGAQQNPHAMNTAAISVNPHNSHWAQFVSFIRSAQCTASDDSTDIFGYYPVYFSEFANGNVVNTSGSWRQMHSIADIATMCQYMNLYDVALAFWHNVLMLFPDEGHYDGEDWNEKTYADNLYDYYTTPQLDLHLNRDPEILILFDPPSLACGSNTEYYSGHTEVSRNLIDMGYLCDTWRSDRFRELGASDIAGLLTKYKLIIIPAWYIMDDGSVNFGGEFDELTLLSSYISNGGKVLLFDSVGLWTFDDTTGSIGQIVREIPNELYPDISTITNELYDIYSDDDDIEPVIDIQSDFAFFGSSDNDIKLSNGIEPHDKTDFNNSNPNDDGYAGDIYLSHIDDVDFEVIGVLESNSTESSKNILGTINSNILYFGARIAPYTLYGNGDLFRRLLASAARWAKVEPLPNTESLLFENSGFEETLSSWILIPPTPTLGLRAAVNSSDAVYGDNCIELEFSDGGYYDDGTQPDLSDEAAIYTTLSDIMNTSVTCGEQYHIYFDAKVEQFACPGDNKKYNPLRNLSCPIEHLSEYKYDKGGRGMDGPYLGVYVSHDVSVQNPEYNLVWVQDLKADTHDENDVISGDWHRYDIPLCIPYVDNTDNIGIKFSVNGEIQLLRERSQPDGDNLIWTEGDYGTCEFANTTVLLDNIGAWNEACVWDTYYNSEDDTDNNGYNHTIKVQDLGSSEKEATFMFMPNKINIGSNRVYIRIANDSHSSAYNGLRCFLVGSPTSYDEDAITWSTKPSGTSSAVDNMEHVYLSNGYCYYYIDITSLYNQWLLTNDEVFAVHFTYSNDGPPLYDPHGFVGFSRETWSEELRPRLVVRPSL